MVSARTEASVVQGFAFTSPPPCLSMYELVGALKGHRKGVCCVKVLAEEPIALSSAEVRFERSVVLSVSHIVTKSVFHNQVLQDGSVCAFDLRTNQLTTRIRVADSDAAVPSVTSPPRNAHEILCCHGASVRRLDRRLGSTGACVNEYQYNSDEINCLSISHRGTLLAASDDAGETAIVDLGSGSLVKLLRGAHTNIASSVAFREHKPWEVITGGLDQQIVHWDFSSGRPLGRWNTGTNSDVQLASETGIPQICNPPFVHCVATPEHASRGLGRLFAAGLGNGSLLVYDAEPPKRARGAASRNPREPQFIASTAHTSAVNFVSFPAAGFGKLLLSGGNDGMVQLRDWTTSILPDTPLSEAAARHQVPEHLDQSLSFQHGRKINHLAAAETDLTRLLVADVSRKITIYALR